MPSVKLLACPEFFFLCDSLDGRMEVVCTHYTLQVSNYVLNVEQCNVKSLQNHLPFLVVDSLIEKRVPVMFAITALPIRTVSWKYCPKSMLSGVRPYEALNWISVAWKVEDSVTSKLPEGHVGEHPGESGAGSQKSLLPVSIRREAGCGGVPTVKLTVYFYRIS